MFGGQHVVAPLPQLVPPSRILRPSAEMARIPELMRPFWMDPSYAPPLIAGTFLSPAQLSQSGPAQEALRRRQEMRRLEQLQGDGGGHGADTRSRTLES